jgi:hypothetical protein
MAQARQAGDETDKHIKHAPAERIKAQKRLVCLPILSDLSIPIPRRDCLCSAHTSDTSADRSTQAASATAGSFVDHTVVSESCSCT